MSFAKTFETAKHGQILLVIQSNDETGNPQIQWSVEPPELGVCTMRIDLENSQQGWNAADKYLADATTEHAYEVAEEMFDELLKPGIIIAK
jgi:hypothetical protein